MRNRNLTLAALALAAAVLAFPPATDAGGRIHGGGTAVIGVYPGARPSIPFAFPDSSLSRSRFQGRFAGHGLRPLGRGVRPLGGGVPIVYVSPAPAYVLYEPPPVIEQAVAPTLPAGNVVPAVPPPPPPPPERDVVQYSDGRYELRGDGIATPYRWVWIPNAPPPPPSARRDNHHLYGWTDAHGALHVTDRWDAIPPQYREEAKRNKSL